ncbi:hypothetical protein GGR57DRAFT_484933 [Xylariaceae sp. FL1272]|nr:hypothetical protein GGR57DRAFT_484933 [Xylariaceae sp. FL1272]
MSSPTFPPSGSTTTRARTGYYKEVNGLRIYVPDQDHCWSIAVEYKCGCPVREENTYGIRRDLVIRVKKNDHCGSCHLRRCIRATETHSLHENCDRHEQEDRRFEGAHV